MSPRLPRPALPRPDWRRGARLVLSLAAVVAFAALLAAAGRNERERRCRGVDIEMAEPLDLHFVDPSAVKARLAQLDPDTFVGKPLIDMDLRAIEAHLREVPHVATADAWIASGGRLRVRVAQRQPVLRVMHNDAVGYYLDIHGDKLPMTPTFTARVPVVTGIPRFEEEAMSAALEEILALAALWQDDPVMQALVEQLHRTPDGDYVLVPKVGQHLVLMGNPAEAPEDWAPAQWNKLLTFYRDGLRHTGWEPYRRVDLRYRDQVVAKK